MKYSISLFRMTNLAHASITVSSIQNIFVMEIFSSGTLSRIHAPYMIGCPVLTYWSPIAHDENIRSIYRLTLKSLSCVIQTSFVASFKRLVLRYVCNIFSNMSRWCHISRTRDLMLKRDTMSSLHICSDVICDIVKAWSTSSLKFYSWRHPRHHSCVEETLILIGSGWKPQRHLYKVITADV